VKKAQGPREGERGRGREGERGRGESKLQPAFDAPKGFFSAEVLLSYLRETRIFIIDKYGNLLIYT
jgi:hypothetical protein